MVLATITEKYNATIEGLNAYWKKCPLLVTVLIAAVLVSVAAVILRSMKKPEQKFLNKDDLAELNRRLNNPNFAAFIPGYMPILPNEYLSEQEAAAAILRRLYPPKTVSIFAVNPHAKTDGGQQVYVVTARLNQWDIEHMLARIQGKLLNLTLPSDEMRALRLDPIEVKHLRTAANLLKTKHRRKYLRSESSRPLKANRVLKTDSAFIEYRLR